MNIQKVSDFKIKGINVGQDFTPKNTPNYDIFPYPYANNCIIGMTTAGKSNTLFNIADKIARKGMTVFLFSSTINHDPLMKKMIDMLKSKKVDVFAKTNFIDDDTGVNWIDIIIEVLNRRAEKTEKEDFKTVVTQDNFGNETIKEIPIKKPKKNKPEKKRPKIMLIIDDLSDMCCHPSIYKWASRQRQYHACSFYSIHNVVSLRPNALRMMHNCFILPNQSYDKIDEIALKLGLCFKQDCKKSSYLKKIYELATPGKYDFLYINRPKQEYRRNFDEKIII